MKSGNCLFGSAFGSVRLTVALALVVIGLSGCAGKKAVVEPVVKAPSPIVSFRFSKPLNVATPSKEPVSVKDLIVCGLFYFQHQRFPEAAAAFEKARARIADPTCELSRRCLVSEAVCRLMADQKPAFVRTVSTLEQGYNPYERMTLEQRDPQLRALLEVRKAFAKLGYH